MAKKEEEKPAVGRPPLPPEKVQGSMIRERVTQALRDEYDNRGGKAWLVRELGRKPRK